MRRMCPVPQLAGQPHRLAHAVVPQRDHPLRLLAPPTETCAKRSHRPFPSSLGDATHPGCVASTKAPQVSRWPAPLYLVSFFPPRPESCGRQQQMAETFSFWTCYAPEAASELKLVTLTGDPSEEPIWSASPGSTRLSRRLATLPGREPSCRQAVRESPARNA